MAAAIEAHEQTHIGYGAEAGLRVRHGLVALGRAVGINPVDVDGHARRVVDAEVDAVRALESRFDEATQNGGLEGVSWELSLPAFPAAP